MTTKPKRIPRAARNPMLMIAGKQRVGAADADTQLLPFLAHLHEVAQGYGHGATTRIVTRYCSAAYDAALYYNHPGLKRAAESAGDGWIEAAERCRRNGINDRVVINGDELRMLRQLACALLELVPGMEVAAWAAFVGNADERWAKYAALAPAFKDAA
jgi:hypothetical protein